MKRLLSFAVLSLCACVSRSSLDSIRGMNAPRSKESMAVSDQLEAKCKGVPYDEVSPAIPYKVIPGCSPAAVTHYTGEGHLFAYHYHGQDYRFVTRQTTLYGGACWQGTNPPLGWYDVHKSTQTDLP